MRSFTGAPDSALDGVYKLSMSDGRPRIKLSENLAKLTLPGLKQVKRMFDPNGLFYGADVITLDGEGEVPVMGLSGALLQMRDTVRAEHSNWNQ